MPVRYAWVRECDPAIGVAVVDRDGSSHAVSVDVEGVVQLLGSGPRRQVVSAWSAAGFRVYPDLPSLLGDLVAGRCLGLVPEMIGQAMFPF